MKKQYIVNKIKELLRLKSNDAEVVLHNFALNKISIIRGQAGSGKSIFLRNLCKHLVSRGKTCMLISSNDNGENLIKLLGSNKNKLQWIKVKTVQGLNQLINEGQKQGLDHILVDDMNNYAPSSSEMDAFSLDLSKLFTHINSSKSNTKLTFAFSTFYNPITCQSETLGGPIPDVFSNLILDIKKIKYDKNEYELIVKKPKLNSPTFKNIGSDKIVITLQYNKA